jgi:hypothetical protein
MDLNINIMEPWQQDIDLFVEQFGPQLMAECGK